MKTAGTYDHYMDYEELTCQLQQFQQRYPRWMRLHSLTQTPQGRSVWGVEVTDLESGEPDEKPAIHLDGNTHAGEVTGSMAVMYLLDLLLSNHDDPQIHFLLQHYTFTLIPRISPDGAEVYLKTPATLRSVDRPGRTETVQGIVKDDLDHDGVIRMMRILDPCGAWKQDEQDPRLMVRRQPDELEGRFYTLMPEGRVVGSKHQTLKAAQSKWNLDFNRNYPSWWKPDQPGAGEYPLDNPETRAVADFLIQHPGIGVMITCHTSGGQILNPPGPWSESEHDAVQDIRIYHQIGQIGTQETGYPLLNLFDGFHCTHQNYAAGAGDDWAYLNRGIFAVTVELWDMLSRAGLSMEEITAQQCDESQRRQQQLKALAWIDQHCPQSWKPWTPFSHPQLGEVEIGGLDSKFVVQNCPPSFLRQECEKTARFALRLCRFLPRLVIESLSCEPLGDGFYRVEAMIANHGYLPTTISEQKRKLRLSQPIEIRLEGFTVLQPQKELRWEGLDGFGQDQTWWSMSGCGGSSAQVRQHVQWIGQGKPGDMLTLFCRCAHAGHDRRTLILK